MKLSEAIRLGSMMKPQGFSQFDTEAPCALRAAMDAAGIQGIENFIPYPQLALMFPLLDVIVICPASGQHERLMCAIWLLNDRYEWSRERIADFVETVEMEQEKINETLNSAALHGMR